MTIVILRLPPVKRQTEIRPRQCPKCHGETFQRWGRVRKPVRDNRFRSVQVYRYRCCHCRYTFRHYPEGVDMADQTQRLRKLAAIYWILGMSLRSVTVALAPFGVQISHMTVWRDLQEQAERLRKHRRWLPVRVLGIDGAYPLLKGKKPAVRIAVDLGDGQPVAIGQVDEANPHAVRRFLEPLIKDLGVSVVVSDDLASFRQVAEKLEVEHQVCQFHPSASSGQVVRRWVGRALRRLRETVPKEWLWVLEEIQTLIAELPIDGSRRLFELWKLIPQRRSGQSGPISSLSQLRDLLLRLSDHWESYRVFDWQQEVPWTNNGTEQAIGRMKACPERSRRMRSRTVRGYKSWQGMQAALLLTGAGIGY